MLKIFCVFAITVTTVLSFKLPEHFLALGQDYAFSVVRLNFLQAYAACKRYGWTLATEKNELQTNTLAEEIKANKIQSVAYWIGGFYQSDQEFLPRWIWLETGESLNYTNCYYISYSKTTRF
ncbi:uncharacterized protein LOC115882953 isoform X2 [Sitophilus oryzae]|uniref:Uncharacterized protein LOC115882953 isoform X2 n=1 Tax=Sitophilus oryzae TaxID=7048 RepID=A0A6J2Y033_SITOR|nr:uncharacterized protein LOC115882953 isoform X2 [Sitophilus oryzae]